MNQHNYKPLRNKEVGDRRNELREIEVMSTLTGENIQERYDTATQLGASLGTTMTTELREEQIVSRAAIIQCIYPQRVGYQLSEFELQCVDKLEVLFESRERAVAKAYGGCEKCYGKGYATSKAAYLSKSGKWSRLEMVYCTCERGNQLKDMVNSRERAAVQTALEKLRDKVYQDEDNMAKFAMPEEDKSIYRKLANALVERINRCIEEELSLPTDTGKEQG